MLQALRVRLHACAWSMQQLLLVCKRKLLMPRPSSGAYRLSFRGLKRPTLKMLPKQRALFEFLQQELLAQAASHEPVSLQVAVLGDQERIDQLEAEAVIIRLSHADDLA